MESSSLQCCIGVPLSNAANVASLSLLIASASSCAVNEADNTDFRRFTIDRFRLAKLWVTSTVVADALVSQLGKVGVGAVLFVDSLLVVVCCHTHTRLKTESLLYTQIYITRTIDR